MILLLALWVTGAEYAGPAACAQCHKDIAAVQRKSNMARTWLGSGETGLPAGYAQSRQDGGFE